MGFVVSIPENPGVQGKTLFKKKKKQNAIIYTNQSSQGKKRHLLVLQTLASHEKDLNPSSHLQNRDNVLLHVCGFFFFCER